MPPPVALITVLLWKPRTYPLATVREFSTTGALLLTRKIREVLLPLIRIPPGRADASMTIGPDRARGKVIWPLVRTMVWPDRLGSKPIVIGPRASTNPIEATAPRRVPELESSAVLVTVKVAALVWMGRAKTSKANAPNS